MICALGIVHLPDYINWRLDEVAIVKMSLWMLHRYAQLSAAGMPLLCSNSILYACDSFRNEVLVWGGQVIKTTLVLENLNGFQYLEEAHRK